ncbi:DUF2510 domain-containing protein [Aurantimicrobium minutum]|uniref:DUF2510 domain-containing protein n=1 Tax=Aurantimicrobium minutum TaxID=708131 RepID=UPI002474237D|nr:DUF2510 domain-containing protein [Aurantimicrobium minutum]MDH6239544.1 hypothetical protein [Aurantimicrobium minutum]
MDTSLPKPPLPNPGWYELPTEPEIERYWDGVEWTDNVRVKKSSLRLKRFSPLKNPFLWKWYALALISLIVATFALSNIGQLRSSSSQAITKQNLSIENACSEILGFDWYELNTRQFAIAADIAGRKSNALLLEKFLSSSGDFSEIDSLFIDRITILYSKIKEVSTAGQWENAAISGKEADKEFGKLSEYCSQYGVRIEAPVISEAIENNSKIDPALKANTPESYIDNGEGVAHQIAPSNNCGQEQYGCTRLELYAYKDCPKGILVYANLFDSNGNEVARTDARSEPLVAGQSTFVMLSTGLSTANTAVPNSFICE